MNHSTVKIKTIIAIATALCALLMIFIFGGSISTDPLTSQSNEKIIEIQPGSVPSSIAQQLVDEQIIADKDSFVDYAKKEGLSSSLKAGTYQLDSVMSLDKIVNIIAEGKVALRNVTILPGSTKEDIKKVFIDSGFDEQSVEAAIDSIQPKDYITASESSEIEGYIAPDTYSLGINASVEDFIIFALQQTGDFFTNENIVAIEEQGLTVDEAVTLASIVQLESSLPENQKKIAQVFIKRLDEGITLGADPTFRYGARLLGLPENPSVDSPYNTRKVQGLTPTAIGNFNKSAIEAVAYPSDTDYLFFVAGDDGVTYFSNTNAEHEALTVKHCIELCKL